jgi:hypothetical protein
VRSAHGNTQNGTLLVSVTLGVTTVTKPVVAPGGTVAFIKVSDTTVKLAGIPLSELPPQCPLRDWSQGTLSECSGEKGRARLRTCTFGDIRVRTVEYTPGYAADHLCFKGHVVLCLSGFVDIEVSDGPHLCLQGSPTMSSRELSIL